MAKKTSSGIAGAALILLAGSTVLCSAARADSISAQQLSLLQQFNLIDLGDLNTTSEVEGRVFVAGNENGQLSNVGFNNGLTPSPAGYATVTIDGNANGSMTVQTGNVAVGGNLLNANLNNNYGTVSQVGGNIGFVNVNGGALQYSGSKYGYVNANGGATVQQVSGLQPGIAASTFATLTNLQASLDKLTPTSSVTIANNTAIFNAVAAANGQAVFNVNASVFAQGQFQFNMNGATSAIINVLGASSLNLNANFLGGQATSLASKLLWNFNSTGTLNVGAEFGGTILAPSAVVNNTASIDGTLVAAKVNQNGELHSDAYAGSLPDGGTTPVPEPASIALLGAGLLALGALRLRARPPVA